MENKDNNNGKYIEGNSKVRLAIFVFLGLWIIAGFTLELIAEKKMGQILSMKELDSKSVIKEAGEIEFRYIIIPFSLFLTIQGVWLSRLGIRTLKAGIHPPPSIKMPFRNKIQTGTMAKLSAMGYLFGALCNFAIIVFMIMKHQIFNI